MKSRISIICLPVLTALVFTACKPAEPAAAPAASTPANATNIVVNAPTPAVVSNGSAATGSTEKVLSPTEAKDHIGENATVRGKVFGVHVTQKGDVFINVGAAYPNAPFVAVCFQGAIPADDLKALDGKTVSFTGKIKEHQGKTEIILNEADQIGGGPAKTEAAKPAEAKPADAAQ